MVGLILPITIKEMLVFAVLRFTPMLIDKTHDLKIQSGQYRVGLHPTVHTI